MSQFARDDGMQRLPCNNGVMSKAVMSKSPRAPAVRHRVRLAADVRAQKILDAALAEFARRGFAAIRVEDIAREAKLSKSGFYAHFQSKEAVFEALLTHSLFTGEVIPFGEDDTPVDFVDRFIDWFYTRMLEPDRLAMLRVLFAEANRVPELVHRWRHDSVAPILRAQARELRAAVRRGQLLDSELFEDMALAYAPLLYWAVSSMIPAENAAVAARELQRQRKLHRAMLLALLRAP